MKAFIFSIIGVVFLEVIVDIIMPSGKTKNIIRCVFAIFALYVIISPIPKIFKSLSASNFALDDNYLSQINSQNITALENHITSVCSSSGLEGIKVMIWADVFDDDIKIQKIYLDFGQVVLSKDKLNIDKYKYAKDIVVNIVDVSEEDIVCYG